LETEVFGRSFRTDPRSLGVQARGANRFT
jgi:hypothetical protein